MGEVVEPTFRSSVTRLVGDEAREWLAGLPALEAEVAARWDLELGDELPGGLLASVRAVRRADGTDAVLKLAGPWDRTADEIACLRLWRGGPAPTLLEADEELERDPARAHHARHARRPMPTRSRSQSLLAAIHVPDELGLRALDVTATPTARPCGARRPCVGAAPRLGANGGATPAGRRAAPP